MKDIIVTVRQQKRELLIWLSCLLCAFLLNVLAIVVYGTDWSELWSQAVWVLVISFLIYVLLWIPRVLYWWVISCKRNK